MLVGRNRVDILGYGRWKLCGLGKEGVIGCGRILECGGFRLLLREALDVGRGRVDGEIIGEDGESELGVW